MSVLVTTGWCGDVDSAAPLFKIDANQAPMFSAPQTGALSSNTLSRTPRQKGSENLALLSNKPSPQTPPLALRDFMLPMATVLMFAGNALDQFELYDAAGWIFMAGGGIFMTYECYRLGEKLYMRTCQRARIEELPV